MNNYIPTTGYEDELSGSNLVRAILDNIHESLKWLWQIVMALALVNAISSYANLLNPGVVKNPYDLIMIFFNINTIVFLSFVLTFIRFYFGESRFLDLSYLETQYYYGLRSEIKKFSGRKRMSDILLLLTHGIFFYFMSYYMGSPISYLYFYIILMFVNISWLLVQYISKFYVSGKKKGAEDEEEIEYLLIGDMDRYRPLLIWSLNNLIFMGAIFVVVFCQWNFRIETALFLTIANSIVDFGLLWNYYFPNLQSLYEKPNKK